MNFTSPESRSTWYSLQEFETHDITSRAYYRRHTKTLSAGKAKEIAFSFVQAREYFRSAAQAGLTVRPLLLYYGVASLSRGLTLFLDHEKREASLRQQHGLKIKDWGQTLSSGNSEIGSLRVRFTKGLFHDLLTATGNRFYFRSNSSVVNWYAGTDPPPIDFTLTLDDIAARVPDVSEQYSAWTEKTPKFLTMQSVALDREDWLYTFMISAANEDEIALAFPPSMFPDQLVRREGSGFQVSCNSADGLFFAQKTGSFGIGDVVIAAPLSNSMYCSPLAACFIVSYFLGMLCRYFPASWINLSRATSGDAFLPLAARLLDWIEEFFPPIVVDLLRGPYDFEST